jgi:integrase/recombinase XerD
MKQLPLSSPSFQYVVHAFTQWLDVQGYATSTVKSLPSHVREFLHYLENAQQITQLQQITGQHFRAYNTYLHHRSNTRHGGALSAAYLNKHHQALERFSEYLNRSGRHAFYGSPLKRLKEERKEIDVVSIQEIKALFTACHEIPQAHSPLQTAIAWRDQAQLVCLYSCGLRRAECQALDIQDINFDKQLLHVRKGKNYKERFVPFNSSSAEILKIYIYDYRPEFKNASSNSALLMSVKGNRMGDLNMAIRLRILITRTALPDLQQKNVTLHTLRHSIATHLLHAGMSLENISRFLGHSSLESTQIYTHLIETNQLATNL